MLGEPRDTADFAEAARLLTCAAGRPGGRLLAVVHPGQPIPWARARSKGGQHFNSSRTRSAEAALAATIRFALGRRPPFPGPVALAALFWRQNAIRCDVDNLTKLVLDALTQAGLWLDDSQVVLQLARKGVDRTAPRTVIVACEA